MTTNGSTPSAGRQVIINQLVLDLKGIGNTGVANILNDLDVLQIYAAEDSIQALTEWKSANGSFDATEVNAPTFTTDVGYTGSTSGSKCIRTNYTPSTDGANYTLSNSSFGVYGTPEDQKYLSGIVTGNGKYAWIRAASFDIDQSLNSGYGNGHYGSVARGLFAVNRDNSINFNTIKDTTVVSTISKASGALPTAPFVVSGYSSGLTTVGGVSNSTGEIFFAGASIEANRTQLYDSFNAYLTSL